MAPTTEKKSLIFSESNSATCLKLNEHSPETPPNGHPRVKVCVLWNWKCDSSYQGKQQTALPSKKKKKKTKQNQKILISKNLFKQRKSPIRPPNSLTKLVLLFKHFLVCYTSHNKFSRISENQVGKVATRRGFKLKTAHSLGPKNSGLKVKKVNLVPLLPLGIRAFQKQRDHFTPLLTLTVLMPLRGRATTHST